jgi:fumarylacetoacetase
MNETHDPLLRSWVASARQPGTAFPVQNLPHAVFRRRGGREAWRGGVAIGDQILDVGAALALGVFDADAQPAACHAAADRLNGLMAMGPAAWSALRLALSRLLREHAPQADGLGACLVPQAQAEYTVPAQVGDYTDFFTSQYHALNAGRVFRPDQPLLPNFKWLPIGYHGRASSIEISGTTFHRPWASTGPRARRRPATGRRSRWTTSWSWGPSWARATGAAR